MDVDMDVVSKEELEGLREDGELLLLLSVPYVTNDAKLIPLKGSSLNHSKQLALISKSILSPVSRGKSPSFKKHDDSDFTLETDSDLDETTETGTENSASTQCYEIAERSWVDYGIKEFILLLTRKMDTTGRNMKLEAKVKISAEYPLRPPQFTVNLYSSPGENSSENDYYEWQNEVRAMEAEVNLHMLKMVPPDEDIYTLSHRVYCLAMLFDYYMHEATPSSEKRKSSSVIDVGLCKPVSGRLLARLFRGRDCQKMISWKDMVEVSDLKVMVLFC